MSVWLTALMLTPTVLAAQPVELGDFDESIMQSLIRTGNWLLFHQNPDGTFSVSMDHVSPGYQDALLLGCAAIILLDTYRLTKEPAYLEAAERTLDLLVEWQQGDGSWGARTRYTVGGVYYPLAAFAKHEIYTKSGRYVEPLRLAAQKLISSVGEWQPKTQYVFEVGEYTYVLLLAWRATGEEDYRVVAERWIHFLSSRAAFDHSQGAWNTFISGIGPQGMWDAALPALPLLVIEDEALFPLANKSARWALKKLSAGEPGAFVAATEVPPHRRALVDAVYTDTANAYSHFSGEFLLLATILGLEEEAESTATWLMSMQAPSGGFYFRKHSDGSIDDRVFLWDSFWAFFGLYEYLMRRLEEVARLKLSAVEEEISLVASQGADTSVARELLDEAMTALGEEDYVEVLRLTDSINRSLSESLDAFIELGAAESILRKAERGGVNVTDLQSSLSIAKGAYIAGNYTQALELARAVFTAANLSLSELRRQAESAVLEAKAAVEQAASLGIDVSSAQSYLAMAEDALSVELFSEAIHMAAVARDLALASMASAPPPTQAGGLGLGALAIPLAIAVGAAAVAISLALLRRKPTPREVKPLEDILDKYVILVEEEG